MYRTIAIVCVLVALVPSVHLAPNPDIRALGFMMGAIHYAVQKGGDARRVTWPLLEQAVSAFADLDDRTKARPFHKIFDELVVGPTVNFLDEDPTDEEKADFLKKIVEVYRLLEPGYNLGTMVGEPIELPEARKFKRVFLIATGQRDGQLTLQDFKAADREIKLLDRKLESIRKSPDVYEHINDMKKLLNFQNYAARQDFSLMMEKLGRSGDVQWMTQLFKDYLQEDKYQFGTASSTPPNFANAQEEANYYLGDFTFGYEDVKLHNGNDRTLNQ